MDTATVPSILDDSPEHELGNLYRAFASRKLDNAEWQRVDDLIHLVARRGVGKSSRKYKIPGRTREDLVESLVHELQKKFFQKRLGKASTIKNFQALLRVTTHHTTVSCLRRIKSPLAGHLEVDPTKSQQFAPAGISDALEFVRERLPEFRFPEFALARDLLLAYRLGTNDYPGLDAIIGLVPSAFRRVVHTAALFDINETMMGIVDP